MSGIPVFWLEPTEDVRVRLRCYESGDGCHAPGYCDADVVIHERASGVEWREEVPIGDTGRTAYASRREQVSDDDPRWPSACERCGTPFSPGACRQVWADLLYSGAPDGSLHSLRDAPVGALYDAEWLHDIPAFTGPDGIALTVATPGGTWHIDSEADNCTRKGDLSHKCWIRHGDPRQPSTMHVDKEGNTCSAGAGSIQCGSYHGFLHHGHLS